MAPINYFVMFSCCSSLAYVRLTQSLEMVCALDRGQHGLFRADIVLWQWKFPTLYPAVKTPKVLGTIVLSLLLLFFFFFPHVYIYLHVILLYFHWETLYLCNIDKSFICHSGYCASYSTSSIVLALGDTASFFSLPCCHTIENCKSLGANHLLSYYNAKQEKLLLPICSVFQYDGKMWSY